jgi:hypothetical protein
VKHNFSPGFERNLVVLNWQKLMIVLKFWIFKTFEGVTILFLPVFFQTLIFHGSRFWCSLFTAILKRGANFNDNKPHPGVPNQSSVQYFTLTYLQLVNLFPFELHLLYELILMKFQVFTPGPSFSFIQLLFSQFQILPPFAIFLNFLHYFLSLCQYTCSQCS